MGHFFAAMGGVRTLWFAEAPEQCEGAGGRRGEAHGGPEPASKRARDARIAIRRDAHNPSLSAGKLLLEPEEAGCYRAISAGRHRLSAARSGL
jgi:hypothetical protein